MRIQDRILDITNNTCGYTKNENRLFDNIFLSFYFKIHTERNYIFIAVPDSISNCVPNAVKL